MSTLGVWLLAEQLGVSAVLTMVCYAATMARTSPARTPARIRIPTYAVWETVVFALNILAFIFIGLQLRPILESLEAADRGRYLAVAGAVLVTVILVRPVWHMSFNAVIRWRNARFGFRPPRPMLRPTVGSGLVISWSGMRGIVSLAAAIALPPAFPYRDLIVLTAFSVVVGTLIIQGLTLKPLLRRLALRDDDPVGKEVDLAREDSAAARGRGTRGVHGSSRSHRPGGDERQRQPLRTHAGLHLGALMAARAAVLAMRARDEIGDDAFHVIEEELDRLEMAG